MWRLTLEQSLSIKIRVDIQAGEIETTQWWANISHTYVIINTYPGVNVFVFAIVVVWLISARKGDAMQKSYTPGLLRTCRLARWNMPGAISKNRRNVIYLQEMEKISTALEIPVVLSYTPLLSKLHSSDYPSMPQDKGIHYPLRGPNQLDFVDGIWNWIVWFIHTLYCITVASHWRYGVSNHS